MHPGTRSLYDNGVRIRIPSHLCVPSLTDDVGNIGFQICIVLLGVYDNIQLRIFDINLRLFPIHLPWTVPFLLFPADALDFSVYLDPAYTPLERLTFRDLCRGRYFQLRSVIN